MQAMVQFLQSRYAALADARKAREMAAYMKTEMPFYGIQKPQRVPIDRELNSKFAPQTHKEYIARVKALWRLPHREEKYAAVQYAISHPRFILPASMPLYRALIVEGAWWDFVDDVAIRLVGQALLTHRTRINPVISRWIDHSNLWLRRSAILAQIRHKEQTDRRQLFDFCLRRAYEKEFFIRKAIGWALRSYAHTNPIAVRRFLRDHRDRLSTLSRREAGKHLD